MNKIKENHLDSLVYARRIDRFDLPSVSKNQLDLNNTFPAASPSWSATSTSTNSPTLQRYILKKCIKTLGLKSWNGWYLPKLFFCDCLLQTVPYNDDFNFLPSSYRTCTNKRGVSYPPPTVTDWMTDKYKEYSRQNLGNKIDLTCAQFFKIFSNEKITRKFKNRLYVAYGLLL